MNTYLVNFDEKEETAVIVEAVGCPALTTSGIRGKNAKTDFDLDRFLEFRLSHPV